MELALPTMNCGVPRIIGWRNGRPVRSAIIKTPAETENAVFGGSGIAGDEQVRQRRSDLAQAMTLSGRCGRYMRVICEGSAPTRDFTIRPLSCTTGRASDAFAARYDSRAPLALRRRVLDCRPLAPAWRRAIPRTIA
jgi:MOSC domain-containing protein YiiM